VKGRSLGLPEANRSLERRHIVKTHLGSKVFTPMPDGRIYPAIAIGDETTSKVTVVNQNTGLPVEIDVTRNDFLSLRDTREGDLYLAVTSEVVMYGYRIVATPRFESVVGLDADEDGAVIPLAASMAKHAESYSKWQAGNFEARRGAAVAAADL
jgi:hypothetical protein